MRILTRYLVQSYLTYYAAIVTVSFIVIAIVEAGNSEAESFANEVIRVPETSFEPLSAVIATIPLQMLAYHVATLKGTDVDQPRNLAKSVTVE